MKKETMEVRQALEQGAKLPYALVQTLSGVTLGVPETEPDTALLTRARYFSETQEIRIFRRDGVLCAVRLTAEPDDRLIRKTFRVASPQFGGEVSLCQCLASDEDGQTYIETTRLTGWKEA